MSAFDRGPDPFERRRIEAAVQRLRDVADEVEGTAAIIAVPPAVGAWTGGARRRHDEHVHTLVTELRSIGAVLRDVADDAWTALVLAVRAAELQDRLARLDGTDGGRPAPGRDRDAGAASDGDATRDGRASPPRPTAVPAGVR